MGKGDQKSRRGKITAGSYGKRRPRKSSSPVVVAEKPLKAKAKAKAETKTKVAKPKAEKKVEAEVEEKPKAKKTTKKTEE